MTDETPAQAKQEAKLLKTEIVGLFNQIQKIRHEIASIKMPGISPNHFGQMSDELDAIVEATETATNNIMENVENIDDIVAFARENSDNEEINAKLDKVPDIIGNIFESCSFQDITGQRVNKIISLLKHVEERVNSLIEFWGEDAILEEDVEKDEYGQYLNGPAARGEGVAQDNVDSFFEGDTDADTLKEIEKSSAGSSTSKQEAQIFGGADSKNKPSETDATASPANTEVAKPAATNGTPPTPLQQDAIDALFD